VFHEESTGRVKVIIESLLPLCDVQLALESILQNDGLAPIAGDVLPSTPMVAADYDSAGAPARSRSGKH
jgi:DNA polymerase II small subunit/DNA polymerase delta subunit B